MMQIVDLLSFVMLIAGIYMIGNGRLGLSTKLAVEGVRARLIGAVLIMPVPVFFIGGFIQGFLRGSRVIELDEYDSMINMISLIIFCFCLAMASFLFIIWSRNTTEAGFDPPDNLS